MAITRVTAEWTGFSGAPGYSNFFFSAFGGGDLVDAEVDRVVAFFNGFRSSLPADVRISVAAEAAILDESSGELIDYANASEQPAVIAGALSGAYSAPAGAAVTWQTDTVARGRRLRGRTFIVPLAGGAYEDDGTLDGDTISRINAGAAALIGDGTGPQAVIWSRPRDGAGGTTGAITGYRVADKAAVLRSRRD